MVIALAQKIRQCDMIDSEKNEVGSGKIGFMDVLNQNLSSLKMKKLNFKPLNLKATWNPTADLGYDDCSNNLNDNDSTIAPKGFLNLGVYSYFSELGDKAQMHLSRAADETAEAIEFLKEDFEVIAKTVRRASLGRDNSESRSTLGANVNSENDENSGNEDEDDELLDMIAQMNDIELDLSSNPSTPTPTDIGQDTTDIDKIPESDATEDSSKTGTAIAQSFRLRAESAASAASTASESFKRSMTKAFLSMRSSTGDNSNAVNANESKELNSQRRGSKSLFGEEGAIATSAANAVANMSSFFSSISASSTLDDTNATTEETEMSI